MLKLVCTGTALVRSLNLFIRGYRLRNVIDKTQTVRVTIRRRSLNDYGEVPPGRPPAGIPWSSCHHAGQSISIGQDINMQIIDHGHVYKDTSCSLSVQYAPGCLYGYMYLGNCLKEEQISHVHRLVLSKNALAAYVQLTEDLRAVDEPLIGPKLDHANGFCMRMLRKIDWKMTNTSKYKHDEYGMIWLSAGEDDNIQSNGNVLLALTLVRFWRGPVPTPLRRYVSIGGFYKLVC